MSSTDRSSGGSSRPRRPRVAVILAAGQGTRMGGDLPKVLHRAGGVPMVSRVLDSARAAGCDRILVVVGYRADAVAAEVEGDGVETVLQAEQNGTGHALAQVEPALAGEPATLLVLSGDVPLVRPETLDALARAAEAQDVWGSLAVATVDEPGSLGRVVRRASSGSESRVLERIVEAADAGPEELAIRTINAGLYALPAPEIFPHLAALSTDNAQGELYLTDALGAAVAAGASVRLVELDDPTEAFGVNTREELTRVDRILAARSGGG